MMMSGRRKIMSAGIMELMTITCGNRKENVMQSKECACGRHFLRKDLAICCDECKKDACRRIIAETPVSRDPIKIAMMEVAAEYLRRND
jgi:hypothetical protein